MSAPLNLASRPFRNTRLPRLMLGLAWASLLGLTALQAVLVWRLLPARTEPRWREAEKLQSQLASLAAREKQSRTEVTKVTLERWAALRGVVDRRSFSWSRLLLILEQTIPPDVRFLSLVPRIDESGVNIDFEAEARDHASVLELLRRLEARPEFGQIYPRSIDESPVGRRLRCTVRYTPSTGGPQ